MKRMVILILILILAGGGYFGFQFYQKMQAVAEQVKAGDAFFQGGELNKALEAYRRADGIYETDAVTVRMKRTERYIARQEMDARRAAEAAEQAAQAARQEIKLRPLDRLASESLHIFNRLEQLRGDEQHKDEMARLARLAAQKNPLMQQEMRRFCLTPEGKYRGVMPGNTGGDFSAGVINFSWKDVNDRAVATAELRLRNKSTSSFSIDQINGLHPVISISDKDVLMWAGPFYINFQIRQLDWRGTENVKEMVRQFIDLNGLSDVQVVVLEPL